MNRRCSDCVKEGDKMSLQEKVQEWLEYYDEDFRGIDMVNNAEPLLREQQAEIERLDKERDTQELLVRELACAIAELRGKFEYSEEMVVSGAIGDPLSAAKFVIGQIDRLRAELAAERDKFSHQYLTEAQDNASVPDL